ncbi:antistasin-like [Stegodyphus dumicola]|uniref:antistasin-like n=1 Tax=Stegodyphus dumicola TaxID=202533 RepID=UPI0015ADC7BA|nr:antistasin-like [Stegodyphus dumicola]
MKTLNVLCVALLFSATCGSNIFTDLSGNTEELLKQSSLEQVMEFQDVEEGKMMLQNLTQDNCDCGPRGKVCEYVKGRRKCICDKGYADDKGVCQRCNCEIPGQICSFGWLDRYCSCPDGYEERYQECLKCVCGPNSKLCYFSSFNGEKRCSCEDGYAQMFGGCQICDCGTNSTSCEFDEKGDKKCGCAEGYSVMQGKCKECSCGDHGKCTFDGVIKSCTCDKGYAVKNGKCEACDCGVNGDCIFDENGKKTCQCYRTFEEYNGICVCKYNYISME